MPSEGLRQCLRGTWHISLSFTDVFPLVGIPQPTWMINRAIVVIRVLLGFGRLCVPYDEL